jgi:Beta-propeller repeat
MRSIGRVSLVLIVLSGTPGASFSQPAPQSSTNAGAVSSVYGRLPLAFEANEGQTDSAVRFLVRGAGYELFLTGDQAVFSLRAPLPKGSEKVFLRPTDLASLARPAVFRMSLERAAREVAVTGEEPLPQKSNYFLGKDPKSWRTGVANYQQVRYRGVYPGVDLVYYGNRGRLEFDFVVAAGADPSQIVMNLEGASEVKSEDNGDLRLTTPHGELRLLKAAIYQQGAQGREAVEGQYVLLAPVTGKSTTHRLGLSVGPHDRSRPLVVDPILIYSTYLGGAGGDAGEDIKVDSAGNAYVVGQTGGGFPGTSGSLIQPTLAGLFDVFVAKINPAGTALVYATYLGGTNSEFGTGIAIDPLGNAYVVGSTLSSDFPTTPGAYQTTFGGVQDAFVTKINPSGTALVYSTYVGGSLGDSCGGIAVDTGGNAYIAGGTLSTADFPTTAGAFQTSFGGGIGDGYVTKLNASGSALVYSTYLGGSGDDGAGRIVIDSGGNAYVTGGTFSTDFPTTVGALQTANGGGRDAFVTKLNAAGSALVYSTYLGGSGDDIGFDIKVDAGGNAYLTGPTSSANFPTTVGSLQPGFAGGADDAFVAKINPAGSAAVYATYLGGSGDDKGYAIAVDPAGDAFVLGFTNSPDFPTDPGGVQPGISGGYDAFVLELNPTGSGTIYSTYLGGSANEDTGVGVLAGIAVDAAGNVYAIHFTNSSDFPTTPGSVQPASGGNVDVFVSKIGAAAAAVPAASPRGLLALGILLGVLGIRLVRSTGVS